MDSFVPILFKLDGDNAPETYGRGSPSYWLKPVVTTFLLRTKHCVLGQLTEW